MKSQPETDAIGRLTEMREQWRMSSVCRKMKQQRDRLLEALEMLMPQAPNNDCECDGYDRAMWDNAAEAITAVKKEP